MLDGLSVACWEFPCVLVGASTFGWGNGESCWLADGLMFGFYSDRFHEVPEKEEKKRG